MLSKSIFVLGLLMAFSAVTAHAQQTGDVRIQVNGHREVHGGGADAKATVTNVGRGESRTVDLNSGGRADVSGLPEGTYIVQVNTGDRMGITYVRVEAGKASTAELSAQGLPKSSTFGSSPEQLLQAARDAANRCDRAAYDAAVTELDRDMSMAEINLRDINRIIEEYGRLTNLQPDLQRLQAVFDSIARRAMAGRAAPTGTARAAGAPVEPGLVHLPNYMAAIREKMRLEARLNAIRAARQQMPPFPENCDKRVGFLGDGKSRFGVSVPKAAEQTGIALFLLNPEMAVIFANRPQTSYFRTEVAGVINKLGAFKPDDTDTGVKFGMSAGIRWDSSLLGTKQLGIEAKIWYVDYNIKDSGEVTADPGGTIGLFSPSTAGNPFGGYFTGGPLTNGWYESKVESFGGEVQVQTWYSSGNFRAMPWLGLRVGRTNVDEDVKFDIGMPVFSSFEQHHDIKDTYIGPTIGLKARYDFAGGLYGFAEGSLGLEYHKGKGDWSTLVPFVETDPRKDKLSSSKWGISAGIKVGLGFEAGAFGLQFGAGVNYTSASPYIEFKEDDSTTTGTGGADIGYGSQREYSLEVRGTVKF